MPNILNTGSLFIGYDPMSNTRFKGSLDEVQILCGALRASEIKLIYA